MPAMPRISKKDFFGLRGSGMGSFPVSRSDPGIGPDPFMTKTFAATKWRSSFKKTTEKSDRKIDGRSSAHCGFLLTTFLFFRSQFRGDFLRVATETIVYFFGANF